MNAFRRAIDGLNDRTGFRSAIDAFLGKKIPPKLPWSYTLGSIALLLLTSQILTGMFLAVYYAATPDHAHDSIRFIETGVLQGHLLRGLHHWGASFLVVAMFLHMARSFAHGSYKKPREVNWILGVKLLIVILAFGLTGYLLPWDQKAYWATTVTLRIAHSVPLVGPFLASILGGGDRVGALTLNRFYAIHILFLPAATLLLIVAHLALVQRHGTAGPPAYTGDAKKDGDRFHPRQSTRDAVAMMVVFLALMITAIVKGAPLDPVADPSDAAYVPRPEWYFLGLFQLLKYFPGKLEVIGTVILPGIATLFLILLPFLDRSPDRGARSRRPFLILGGAGLAVVVILTALGARDPGGSPEPSWKKSGRTPFAAVAGPLLLEKRQCGACHRADGFGSGPPLAGLARSRTMTWIRDHISDPEYVAPGARDPENRAPGSDTAVILAWLDLTGSGPVPAGSADESESIALVVREGCAGCHKIDGAGGSFGPALNGVKSRHDRQWIIDYLPNPEAVNPDAKMKSYPDLSLEDRERIASWLMTLN